MMTSPQSAALEHANMLARIQVLFAAAGYVSAETLANECHELAERRGDERARVQAQIWIGAAQTQQGRYEEALATLHAAITAATACAEPVPAARAWNYIAICHEELGDIEAAIGFYERGLIVARSVADAAIEVHLLANLGDALVTNGQWQRGLDLLVDGARVAKQVGDVSHYAWCLGICAQVHESRGDTERARELHVEAIVAAERGPSGRVRSEKLKEYGEFLGRHGDLTEAITLLRRALNLAQGLGIRREIYKTHFALAVCLEHQERWRDALQHYKAFHEVRASVFDDVLAAKVANLTAQAELERERHDREIARLCNEDLTATLVAVERQAGELQQLSWRDPLTGAYNRRHLESMLRSVFASSRASGSALCVAMVDVDHFKQVNDHCSHAVGDAVLVRLVELLESGLRAGDLLARYGGEEFVLVMPGTTAVIMAQRCEQLRLQVQSTDWRQLHLHAVVTVSIGVADAGEAENAQALLQLADRRLYLAKDAGRNRVCTALEDPGEKE